MRQNSSFENQGHQAHPSESASTLKTKLHALAARLRQVHPADVLQGAAILAEFAGAEMRDPDYTAGYGTRSATEELACCIVAVLEGSSGREFAGALQMYGKLLNSVHNWVFGCTLGEGVTPAERTAAQAVCKELVRIEVNLGTENDASPYLHPLDAYLLELTPAAVTEIFKRRTNGERPVRMGKAETFPPLAARTWHWFQDKFALAAGLCVALLIWDITSDTMPLWQILAGMALVAGVCGLMYRLGTKRPSLQTPAELQVRRRT